MRSTPSRPPETAFVIIVSMPFARYVNARTSIGRLTPATTSTRPGTSSLPARLHGVAP